MKGAIAGDVVGSVYEHYAIKTKDFPLLEAASRFTDDTVCTVAVADCLLNGRDAATSLRDWGRRYPDAGFGGLFLRWLVDASAPAYGSWGNGGAMRVSPCGHLAGSLDEALALADRVTIVTHSHFEGMRGARAVAGAVWLARQGEPMALVRRWVETVAGYDLAFRLDDIRDAYGFDISAAGTVPPALVAALDAGSFEDAIRAAVSLGGDSDTLAAIAGSVAEPLFGVPDELWSDIAERLTPAILAVVDRFYRRLVDAGEVGPGPRS